MAIECLFEPCIHPWTGCVERIDQRGIKDLGRNFIRYLVLFLHSSRKTKTRTSKCIRRRRQLIYRNRPGSFTGAESSIQALPCSVKKKLAPTSLRLYLSANAIAFHLGRIFRSPLCSTASIGTLIPPIGSWKRRKTRVSRLIPLCRHI